jgi:hypothetical protein
MGSLMEWVSYTIKMELFSKDALQMEQKTDLEF